MTERDGGRDAEAAPVDGPEARKDRFVRLYDDLQGPITAYVLRRLPPSTSDASDLVADIFATAWRRFDDVPGPPDDRLWLYGVARNLLHSQRRTALRHLRLGTRLAGEPGAGTGDPEPTDGSVGAGLTAALDRLPETDREVLRLVLWDDLTHREAAVVLGCTTNALGVRLHRARARLRRQLGLPDPSPAVDPLFVLPLNPPNPCDPR